MSQNRVDRFKVLSIHVDSSAHLWAPIAYHRPCQGTPGAGRRTAERPAGRERRITSPPVSKPPLDPRRPAHPGAHATHPRIRGNQISGKSGSSGRSLRHRMTMSEIGAVASARMRPLPPRDARGRVRMLPARDARGRFVSFPTTNAPSWYVLCADAIGSLMALLSSSSAGRAVSHPHWHNPLAVVGIAPPMATAWSCEAVSLT
jgi:hypothetical protein